MNKEWPRVSLAELLYLQRRPVTVVADHNYQEIGIYSYGGGIFHKLPRTGLEVGGKDLFLLKEGDFILQITFAWEGAIALCSHAEEGLYGSVRYPTYRADETKCLPSFLLRYLLTREGLAQIGRICPGSAGRNRVLALKRLGEVSVPLPPIDEQQRILGRVDAIAQQIEEARRLRSECDKDLRSLLLAMAHRADLDEQAKSARGWRKKRLSDIMSLSIDAHQVAADRQYPNVGLFSFARGLFHKPPIDGALTSANMLQKIRAGQFIYSRLFAFEGAYGIVTPEFDGSFVSSEYPTFDCNPEHLRPEFLLAYTLSQTVWKDLAKGSKGLGHRRQRLQPKKFLAHEIWVPPLSWQDELVDVYQRIAESQKDRERISAEMEALLPSVIGHALTAKDSSSPTIVNAALRSVA